MEIDGKMIQGTNIVIFLKHYTNEIFVFGKTFLHHLHKINNIIFYHISQPTKIKRVTYRQLAF